MDTPGNQQGSVSGGDSNDLIAVYEFCAAEYGWGPDYIEAWVTDSQLIEFLDRAITRRSKQSQVEIDRVTLGVNTGTLITYDRDALRSWRSRHPAPPDPQQFTATVGRLAARFPGKVKMH